MLSNIKAIVIINVVRVFKTIPKGLKKTLRVLDIGGRIETIQTPMLLKSACILRRIREK